MLLFGKQYTKKNKNKIGGVIKLFELFKVELNNNSIEYEVIDLNWRNYTNPIFAYVYIVYAILFKIRKHNSISFHGTANEFIYLAPLVVFVSKQCCRKVSLRKFAGNFDAVYSNSFFLQKWVIKYVLKNSDCNFFETKYLVNYFSKFNPATFWFPNVRPRNNYSSNLVYNKKFVFIGHVIKEKGIRELLDAFLQLDSVFKLDVYGPLGDDFTQEECCNRNTRYCGVLPSEDVCRVLKDYDMLILPSYREGYPGVIIEAFSVGMPVIASSLDGICEMITDSENGKLIEPKSVRSIVTAVKSLDVDTVIALKENAAKSFAFYDSDKITRDVISKLNS